MNRNSLFWTDYIVDKGACRLSNELFILYDMFLMNITQKTREKHLKYIRNAAWFELTSKVPEIVIFGGVLDQYEIRLVDSVFSNLRGIASSL